MGTIWILGGFLIIGGVLGNQTTTSTVPSTSNDGPKTISTSPSTKKSTTKSNRFKSRRAIGPVGSFEFIIPAETIVPSSASILPRVGVNSAINNPYQYHESSSYNVGSRNIPLPQKLANRFPIPQGDYSKPLASPSSISNYAPYTSSAFKLIPESSKLSLSSFNRGPGGPDSFQKVLLPPSSNSFSHLSSPSSLIPSSSNSAYPKFEESKFSRINSRPLSGNIPIPTHSSVYSPNFPEPKSTIKSSPSLSTSSIYPGNFKPVNPAQFQNSAEFPNGVRTYNLEPQSSYLTTFNNPSPHLPVRENLQAIPVYSPPNNNYQFPKKKVAAENYELFSSQPQLHFHKNQQPIYHSQPFERIRTDVEVINKKRPSVPQPQDDEEDFDVGYKNPSTVTTFSEENAGRGRVTAVPKQTKNYELPSSSVFNSYDAAFGKYSKLIPDVPTKAKIIEKPERYIPNVHEEPEKQVYEAESEESSPEYQEKYRYEDESESSPKERLQRDHEDEGHDDHSSYFDSYGHDFERDFDESYHSEIPVEEYTHVKEVPDFEGSASNEKIVSESKEESVRSSRDEKKHRTKITTTTAAPWGNNYGRKFPRQSRVKSDSAEQATEALPKHNYREAKNKRLATTSRPQKKPTFTLSTSFNAPNNGIKALNDFKQVYAVPYIHRGGLQVVDPPALGPSAAN